MKKVVILLFVLIFMSLLKGITIEVNIDGTGDYITIQAGINASSDGDIVLVYPGRYYEHINYNGKTITVGSLNLTTGEEHYIRETIIDGSDNGSCVRLESEEGAMTTLQGFTLTNGAGDLIHPAFRMGGGILMLESSHLSVINCLITHNRASGGGGILASTGSLYLEGTTINYNRSSYLYSGGLSTINMQVVFSEETRCNIYNNYGHYANDVCNSGGARDYTVIVDTFTVLEPDQYYLMGFNNATSFEIFDMEYDILNGYVDAAEYDIYVDPLGNNSNSGISPDVPMQSITEALIRIQADENNPLTVHLAPGLYSPSDNGQILPLHMKSFVSLEGAGMYDTIIDGEDYYNILYDKISRNGYAIRNLSFENFFSPREVEPYSDQYSCYFSSANENLEYLLIDDVRFAFCGDGSDPGFYNYYLVRSTRGLDLSNVIFEDNESRICGLKLYGYPNGGSHTINITNTIMRNNDNFFGLVYFGNENANNQLNIIDLEFTRNHFDYPNSTPGATYCQGMKFYGPSQINIINSTFSDNTLAQDNGTILDFQFSMNINMFNTIISGYPYNAIERCLGGDPSQEFILDHCLIEGGIDDVLGAGLPGMVYGEVLTHLPFYDYEGEYPYYLAYNSPCIGAGTLELPDEIELPDYDFMGNPRIVGTNIDIGAYEWNGWGTPNDYDEIMQKSMDIMVFPNPIIPGKMRDGKARIEWRGEDVTGEVSFEIFNVKGQRLRELKIDNGKLKINTAYWDMTDNKGHIVSSGVYFLRMKAEGEYKAQRKVVLCN
ncbi:MAG: hypothetical protein K9N06_00015 [Candidatus Cloacimonetes bacterium]|nr:hypothetical protein [Candidatus Cloacimonadota bacterium]